MLDELRGIALAQLDSQRLGVPIRVLLASAGNGMDHGKAAAQRIAAARDRERIAAVIGMGVSREGVRDAMVELDAAGIPMVGTLVSADQLTEATRHYHQVGPINRREAAVAAFYARTALRARRAFIYYSGDPKDLYSSNLAKDAKFAFEQARITVRESVRYRAPRYELVRTPTVLAGRSVRPGRTRWSSTPAAPMISGSSWRA